MVTTGDFASLYAKPAGAHWRLMTPPQHLWYFTRESIARLGQSLRLRLESFGHPWKVVPMSLLMFQIGRMHRHARRRSISGEPPGIAGESLRRHAHRVEKE